MTHHFVGRKRFTSGSSPVRCEKHDVRQGEHEDDRDEVGGEQPDLYAQGLGHQQGGSARSDAGRQRPNDDGAVPVDDSSQEAVEEEGRKAEHNQVSKQVASNLFDDDRDP